MLAKLARWFLPQKREVDFHTRQIRVYLDAIEYHLEELEKV